MKNHQPFYIDIFAGCGGLSTGLLNAGWTGLFAVEKNKRKFTAASPMFPVANSEHFFSHSDRLSFLCTTIDILEKRYDSHIKMSFKILGLLMKKTYPIIAMP